MAETAAIAARLDWATPPSSSDPPATLVVVKGDTVLSQLPLTGRAWWVLGRGGPGCDIVQEHPSLSRRHAAVAHGGGGRYYLVDLESTHGTMLGDERLVPYTRTALTPSSPPFRLGSSTRQYTLHLPSPPASPPPAAATAAGTTTALSSSGHGGLMPPPPPKPRATLGPARPPAPAAATGTPPPPTPPSTTPTPSLSMPSHVGGGRTRDDEDGPVWQPPPPGGVPTTTTASLATAAAAAAATRAARQAEIAAAIASFSMPARVSAHPTLPPASDQGAMDTAAAMRGEEEGEEEDDDEEEDADAAMAAAMGLPTTFGKRKSGRVGGVEEPIHAFPPAKRARVERARHDSDSEGDSDDGDDGAGGAVRTRGGGGMGLADVGRELGVPWAEEAVLEGHRKRVTVCAFDTSGRRLITGGSDYHVRVYDFGSMDSTLRCARDLMAEDGHPITSLGFSPDGTHFLAGCTSVKLRVFDADTGKATVTTVRGDMYLNDVSHTKGHIASVTSSWWHPVDPDYFWSASADSSVRLWNVNGKRTFDELQCQDVIRVKSGGGVKTGVTAATMTPDGRTVIAAGEDGSLQWFHVKSGGYKFARPDAVIRDAHVSGDTAITAANLSPDGCYLATRGSVDECIKLWDVRKLSASASRPTPPLAVLTSMPTLHPGANVAWSPDGRVLLAGDDVPAKAGGGGAVHVWQRDALCSTGTSGGGSLPNPAHDAAAAHRVVCPTASAAAVTWHPTLNQVVVGCGDGTARVLYDEATSQKGLLLALARVSKRRVVSEDTGLSLPYKGVIIAPNALPQFREEVPGFKYPGSRRGGGGAGVGGAGAEEPHVPEFMTQGSRTFTQHYMKNLTEQHQVNLRKQDSAEVLRSYAEKAAAISPSSVYATTQPKPVLASKTIEQEEEEAAAELAAFLKANVAGR